MQSEPFLNLGGIFDEDFSVPIGFVVLIHQLEETLHFPEDHRIHLFLLLQVGEAQVLLVTLQRVHEGLHQMLHFQFEQEKPLLKFLVSLNWGFVVFLGTLLLKLLEVDFVDVFILFLRFRFFVFLGSGEGTGFRRRSFSFLFVSHLLVDFSGQVEEFVRGNLTFVLEDNFLQHLGINKIALLEHCLEQLHSSLSRHDEGSQRHRKPLVFVLLVRFLYALQNKGSQEQEEVQVHFRVNSVEEIKEQSHLPLFGFVPLDRTHQLQHFSFQDSETLFELSLEVLENELVKGSRRPLHLFLAELIQLSAQKGHLRLEPLVVEFSNHFQQLIEADCLWSHSVGLKLQKLSNFVALELALEERRFEVLLEGRGFGGNEFARQNERRLVLFLILSIFHYNLIVSLEKCL